MTSPNQSEEQGRTRLDAQGANASMTLFALLWGAAAVFHNLGPSGVALGVFGNPTTLKVSQALLSLAAVWLILQPKKLAPLVVVAILGLITAWFEAPRLGNHWLLTGFVDVAILLSLAVARRGGKFDRQAFVGSVLPTARWCLIVFYSFAAFAKLNSAFFNPDVSCGAFFFDETARGYGLPTPIAVGAGGLERLIPFGAAMTELAIPVLLIGQRTRVLGVLVGLFFHSFIALDRIHLFVDFSAVLAALFLLFMPHEFAESALRFLEGKGKRLFALTFGLGLLVAGAQLTYSNNLMMFIFLAGRMVVWYVFDLTIVIGTVVWLIRHRKSYPPLERPFALPRNARLLMAPLILVVLLNGFFPYLELRTAYAYTMYSNLTIVDGESNHLLVRRSLPVGKRQHDLVRIVSSSDPGLARYADSAYELPWDTFRTYMAAHPEAAVTYERSGERFVLQRAADDPDLVDAPSVLVQKAIPLRAIDTREPPRCQDVFLPAL
jgi:hypothetical protein